MDPNEARLALAESALRQAQTVRAGSAPWARRTVLTFACALIALGLVIDADMVWLSGLLVVALGGVGAAKAVTLRRTRSSRGWVAALIATFALAVGADIAVQFAVRAADLPLPNTWGASAAAVVVVLVTRPVQARAAASLRP